MCNKVNLEEIKNISKDEFIEILKSWMDQKEITKTFQKKLRKDLFNDFQRTALGKNLIEIERQKKSFDPKKYVLSSIEAEKMFCDKNFFTLSVFSTEIESFIPNFEKDENFRFGSKDIQDYMEILGLMKDDKIVKQIVSIYKTSNESLLSILLRQLILNHKSKEIKTTGTQTIEFEQNEVVDLSQLSYISRATRKRSKRKNHSLINHESEQKTKVKRKRSKCVALIAQNLDKMSQNISTITDKLDDYKKSSSHDDSKSILTCVGNVLNSLNGCVNNFEKLCNDIKAVNEKKTKDYDEWLDELKNSDNGKKFLRKFSKSFDRILDEEKNKVQKDLKGKFEREKRKLSKLYQNSIRAKKIDASTKQPPAIKALPLDSQITKDIGEIYRHALQTIKNVEQENEIFEKSVEIDIMNRRKMREIEKIKQQPPNIEELKEVENDLSAKIKLDLNECRKIHSSSSSSANNIDRNSHSYGSISFEDDISDINI